MATIAEELHALVDRLSPEQQRRLLELAQTLNQTAQNRPPLPKSTPPPGTPASVLLRLQLPIEAAKEMERALEDCERIDPDEY